MPRRSRRYLRAAGALALASGPLLSAGGPAALSSAALSPAALSPAALSPAALSPAGTTASVAISPMLESRFESAAMPPDQGQCVIEFTAPCYGPAQLQAAYHEQPLFDRGITGRGQTIVIVDPFGSPTIRQDLAAFDAAFGLPAPPALTIIQPAGPVPGYDPADANDVNWAGETTLDVEWAHAMAPGASILLAETPVAESEGTAGFPEIVRAENYVIDHHLGQVISQSFSATEQTFPAAASIQGLRSAYLNAQKNHVTVLASTGDTGATNRSDVAGTSLYTHPVVAWPASDPLVTAVGGTQLALLADGSRTQADRVWNDSTNYALNNVFSGTPGPVASASGGGRSAVFARPAYQSHVASVTGGQRGVPDISMSAACSGLVDTYQSFPGLPAGWYVTCGTSESSPLFAGIVALADQAAGHSLGLINPALYALSAERAPGVVDVTAGNNSVSFIQDNHQVTVPGFQAEAGYDLASGVGTVDAALFVPELAGVAGAAG